MTREHWAIAEIEGVETAVARVARHERQVSRGEIRARFDVIWKSERETCAGRLAIFFGKWAITQFATQKYREYFGYESREDRRSNERLVDPSTVVSCELDPLEAAIAQETPIQDSAIYALEMLNLISSRLEGKERDFFEFRLAIYRYPDRLTTEVHRKFLKISAGAYRMQWYRLCKKIRCIFDQLTRHDEDDCE